MSSARSGVRVVEGARLEIVYAATYREFESLPLRQNFMTLQLSEAESEMRKRILTRVMDCIHSGTTIKLPPFDESIDRPSDQFALQSVGLEPNEFGGRIGNYRYQFEGEEDLLHLFVCKIDGTELEVSEAQAVCGALLDGVAPALIWLKPGTFSQHFYVGHDELISTLRI